MKKRVFSKQLSKVYVSLWIGLYGFSVYRTSSNHKREYKLGLFMLKIWQTT